MSGRQIGNYLITEYIGGGGFGSVFKAEDTTQPGRIVAIKELHKKHTRNTVIKQRFFQEAVAMARLDHPNLPRLFTFGEDNGCYYLVMEFISGRVLADELHANGAMSAELAAGILAQVLEAVSYAHRNGIIHRDLKPDNIILIDDGGTLRVKVLDFGIARLVGGENLTLAGEGFGTPAYMSPERMWGNTSDDPRIDIYAIGIILFEMLTGRPPFQSDATDPVVYWSEMRALHESTPLPLSSSGAPAEIERLVTRATAKRVEDRYAAADDMLDELKRIKGASIGAQMAETLLVPTGMARLMLTTVPGGAEVYVDDTPRGSSDAIRGKILIEQLTPGLRTVRVSKQGYSDYKISVSLEASRQTDLQVALAARVTAMMPPVEVTAAGGFGTEKFANADTRTAVVLESLPAGSTVFLGSEAIAAADEDGRATLQLPPGAHAIRVTGPNGASATTVIHVTEADSDLLKTVAMPLEPKATPTARPALPTNQVAAPASTPFASADTRVATSPGGGAASAARPAPRPAPVAVRPGASPQGRRIAYAAAAVLLIMLAAGAFIVFRRPARGNPPPDAAPVQPNGVDASTPNASASENVAKATDANAAQGDAERAALEKKRAEAERKQKEEPQKPANDESAPSAPATATAPATPPAPAPTPTPPSQAEAEPAAAQGTTCLGVWVTGAAGEMAPADLRVVVIEEPDTAAAAMYNGRTNEKGRLRKCGLTAGHRVRAVIFGPRGAMLGSRMQTLNAGLNIMQIQLERMPGNTPQAEDSGRRPFPRKRPRWQQP
jgi:Protein kinase domain/PEGA domain